MTACTLCGSTSHTRSSCPMGKALNTMRVNYRRADKQREAKAITSAINQLEKTTREARA